MSQLPGYKLRIESLLFKSSFDEKMEEVSKLLKVIEQSAVELRASQKLAKVLEVSHNVFNFELNTRFISCMKCNYLLGIVLILENRRKTIFFS